MAVASEEMQKCRFRGTKKDCYDFRKGNVVCNVNLCNKIVNSLKFYATLIFRRGSK